MTADVGLPYACYMQQQLSKIATAGLVKWQHVCLPTESLQFNPTGTNMPDIWARYYT